ncbi:MAG: DNA methyltransferase [Candidatus Tisiphia sp.]
MVLDPFVGSGSSFVASLKNSRKCIGAEIDKNFMIWQNSSIFSMKVRRM